MVFAMVSLGKTTLPSGANTHGFSTTQRIKEVAKSHNCNAAVGLRYNSHFTEGVLRVTAYGTACVVD